MAALEVADGVTELRVRTFGDSETAFCFGGRGEILDELQIGGPLPLAPWFGTMKFYGVPKTGYTGSLFGDGFEDENGDPVGGPVPASGNGRDGFTTLGVGADTLIASVPDEVTVNKIDYALGGSLAENWYNDIPDWRGSPGTALDIPSSDWLGYRSVETGVTIGRQIRTDVEAGHRPIIIGSLGGNDIFQHVRHTGGVLLSNTAWWDAFFDTYQDHIEALVDYFHWCAGGDPDAAEPGNCEVILISYPNFNICGDGDEAETIQEYFPQDDIDGSVSGARRAFWSMDQLGFYREFYKDTIDATPLPHPDTSHPNYRVGIVGPGTAFPTFHRGPIPLADQLDRTKCPAARYALADAWYLDRAFDNRFGFDVINSGDKVNRTLGTWTVNASLATIPPTTALFSGTTWRYTSRYGPQGVPGDADYAPRVMDGLHIGSRTIHENVINAHMQRLGDELAAVEQTMAARYGDNSTMQYVPMWDYHTVTTRDDCEPEYKPWPIDLWFDHIHLNAEGAEIWTTGIWETMAPRSQLFAATVAEPWDLPTATAPGGGWTIFTGDENLVRTGKLTEIIRATVIDRHARTPAFTIEVAPDSRDAQLLNEADRVEFVSYETKRTFLSGPITRLTRTRRLTDGDDESVAVFSGPGDMCWLDWRLASPQPTTPRGPYTTDAHDVRSGYATRVIYEYVTANAGPPALTRAVPQLTVLDPPPGGNRVTGRARWQSLGALVASLATEGLVTYRVVQKGRELEFSCRPIRDVSDDVIFSAAVNNLDSWTFEWEAATATHAVVGGQGEGVDRTIVEVTDTAAAKRIELFVHKPDTHDYDELYAEGEAQLAERAERQSLTAIPSSITGLGDTWGVGDLTTVSVEGVRTEAQITEVTLEITPDNVKPTVTIGPPAEAELAAIYKTLRRIDSRTRTLERTV